MLEQVYRLALSRREVGQITVEDPAPGFVRVRVVGCDCAMTIKGTHVCCVATETQIRNILDCKLCIKAGVFARYLQCETLQRIFDAIALPSELLATIQSTEEHKQAEGDKFQPDKLPDLPAQERNTISEVAFYLKCFPAAPSS